MKQTYFAGLKKKRYLNINWQTYQTQFNAGWRRGLLIELMVHYSHSTANLSLLGKLT